MSDGKRNNKADWVIDISEAARKRGIDTSYQMWLKLGGSKSTWLQYFNGTNKMIRVETMNQLHEELGILPFEYIKNSADQR